LSDWAKKNKKMFKQLSLKTEIDEATDIINKYPQLINPDNPQKTADPFIIAFAKCRELTVITSESFDLLGKPKIPLVCRHKGVRCINNLALIKEQGWIF